jgi:DNA (cytosine-5)-methyltransferase 1
MNQTYNLVEFFSGIGSQARALENLNININTLGTCEWDIHAFVAYDAIHNSPELDEETAQMEKPELLEILKNYTLSNNGKHPMEFNMLKSYSVESLRYIYSGIKNSNNFVDISSLNGKNMPENVDILTYSFPCQDLSNVGAFHGYNKGIDKDSNSRSSLLWQVGRILKEMKDADKSLPRFLLMENVPTLLSKRHLGNFNMWIDDLKNLGYFNRYFELNASDFGLPQNRPRLLMLSVFFGDDEELYNELEKHFEKIDKDTIKDNYHKSKFYHKKKIKNLLRTDYSKKKCYEEALECTPNDTPSRRKIWEENPQIVLPDGSFNPQITSIRTITTKQDRNPNSGNLYFDSGVEGKSKFRYLTPRECLLFMGFKDKDYRNIKKRNVEFHKGDQFFPRDKIIRMAGNSIPVKLLEGVFYLMLQTDDFIEEYRNGCTR